MIRQHVIQQKMLQLPLSLCFLAALSFQAYPKEEAKKSPKSQTQLVRLIEMLEGIAIGKESRLFPYASLEDWFDPYGGLKLKHPAPWSRTDRIVQLFKFETFRDYSWKFRYIAPSLSGKNVLVGLLFKLKYDRDAFFYGVGNDTKKIDRVEATYGSVLVAAEFKSVLAEKLVLSWSPGFWSFQSGLMAGGEFEEPANAQFVTSRLAVRGVSKLDYQSHQVTRQLSAYVEFGIPLNEAPAFYTRLNLESQTRIPLLGRLKFGLGTRIEYLLSTDRANVPYFALSETGSRSGLRGYSKERFRNFALAVTNLELSHPLSRQFELFLLSDLAIAGSDPVGLIDNKLHRSLGAGLRFINKNNPISAGIAKGLEGWKAFSTINAALSF
ncbi:hypothetical protein MJD09_08680 [bacterium]|nr:hypothetical protein [bacterium]